MVTPNPYLADIDDIVNDPELGDLPQGEYDVDEIINENMEDSVRPITSKKLKAKDSSKETMFKLTSDEYAGMHPLDAIEKKEREISEQDYPNLESKFVLTNFQLRDHKKLSNITYKKLETINKCLFQGQDDRAYGGFGNPRSLTV